MDFHRKPCTSVGLGAFRAEENEPFTPQIQADTNLLDCSSLGVYISGVSNPTPEAIKEAARVLGSIKNKKRAKASRENGKLGGPFGHLGGRPKKNKKKGKKASN